MAQISVPTSIGPIIPTGSEGKVTAVGAATLIDAVADSSQTNYVRITQTADSIQFGFGLQSLVDPFVDTGHLLRVVLRWDGFGELLGNIPGQVRGFLSVGVPYRDEPDVTYIKFLLIPEASPLGTSFQEVVINFDASEVQAFRAAGGYITGPAVFLILQFDSHESPPVAGVVDVAYIAFEAPDAAAQSWWYKASTDEYKYQASDPGGGYVQTTPPVMKAWGQENPIQGVNTGGTNIIISGDGFASGLTVTFGGVSATSIVVVNQHTITCNTPAFGGSLSTPQIVDVGDGDMKSANTASVTVTVTNPDGQSASV